MLLRLIALRKGRLDRMMRSAIDGRSSRFAESAAPIPIGLRILALFLRTLFVGALVAISVRVSTPQSETLWSVHETPGDLVRLALVLAVCLWVAIHLFTLPKTVEAYQRVDQSWTCDRSDSLGSSRHHVAISATILTRLARTPTP